MRERVECSTGREAGGASEDELSVGGHFVGGWMISVGGEAL